jgi:hypothetical protein
MAYPLFGNDRQIFAITRKLLNMRLCQPPIGLSGSERVTGYSEVTAQSLCETARYEARHFVGGGPRWGLGTGLAGAAAGAFGAHRLPTKSKMAIAGKARG